MDSLICWDGWGEGEGGEGEGEGEGGGGRGIYPIRPFQAARQWHKGIHHPNPVYSLLLPSWDSKS